MRYLILILSALVLFSCDNSSKNNDEQSEATVKTPPTDQEVNANTEVEFSCDSLGENKYALSILVSTYDKAIPVDTLNTCTSMAMKDAPKYQAPDYINALAEGGDYIYYSAIKNNQLIVMRSPRGQSMNYQVHLTVPLDPAIEEQEGVQQ